MYGIPSRFLAFLNLPIQAAVLPFAPDRPEVEVLKGMARGQVCTASFKLSRCVRQTSATKPTCSCNRMAVLYRCADCGLSECRLGRDRMKTPSGFKHPRISSLALNAWQSMTSTG